MRADAGDVAVGVVAVQGVGQLAGLPSDAAQGVGAAAGGGGAVAVGADALWQRMLPKAL